MYNRFDLPEKKNIMIVHPFIYDTKISHNVIQLIDQNSINFQNLSFSFPLYQKPK
jgi:hypothetical protein